MCSRVITSFHIRSTLKINYLFNNPYSIIPQSFESIRRVLFTLLCQHEKFRYTKKKKELEEWNSVLYFVIKVRWKYRGIFFISIHEFAIITSLLCVPFNLIEPIYIYQREQSTPENTNFKVYKLLELVRHYCLHVIITYCIVHVYDMIYCTRM